MQTQAIINLKFCVLAVFIVFITAGCKKDEDSPNLTNGKTTAVFNVDKVYGNLTDIDGNKYKTITIGTQTWMAENLRTGRYNDGTIILNESDEFEWTQLGIGAFHQNLIDPGTISLATYGRFYNWFAIGTGKLAPSGWHVSTDADWDILINFLNGPIVAGGSLKESGTTHWYEPNSGATNISGFTALPAGGLVFSGTDYGRYTAWWTASEYSTNYSFIRSLDFDNTRVKSDFISKANGYPVRCVKDEQK
jgi:uncharacterized protein (TIGR02145 family)